MRALCGEQITVRARILRAARPRRPLPVRRRRAMLAPRSARGRGMIPSRRNVLAAGAAALVASAYSNAIAQALAIPARADTGTIRDVEHVVILMQENRSFDHYFG